MLHAQQLKPHIGLVSDTQTPVVLGDDDIESEYKVKQVLDIWYVKLG